MEPDTVDQAIPAAAPKPTMFSVPVALGDRTITAYVDANTQEEAQALIESRRQRLAEVNPQQNVYAVRGQAGGYGYSYDTADETTARANVQKGLANQDAVYRFTNENQQLDSTIENNYGALEVNDIMSDIDAINAEAAQNAPKKSIGEMAVSAGKDIAFGVGVEGPTQVLAGAASGINETLDAIQIAGNALSEIIPNPYVVWSGVGDGVAGNAQFRVGMTGKGGNFQKDAKDLGVNLNESPFPEVPVVGQQPTSVTGNVVRSVSQFAAAMGVAGKALKGWQTASTVGRFSKAIVTGAIADFAAFDEADKRLSDLIETVPELSNPVTEWLASDEDDTALESRLKNVVEGGLLGVGMEAVPALVKQISAYRQLKRTQAQVKPQADQLMAETIAAEKKVVTDLNEAVKILGDPEADLVRVKAAPKQAQAYNANQTTPTPPALENRSNDLPIFHGTRGEILPENPSGLGVTYYAPDEYTAQKYAQDKRMNNPQTSGDPQVIARTLPADAKILDTTTIEGAEIFANLKSSDRLVGQIISDAKKTLAKTKDEILYNNPNAKDIGKEFSKINIWGTGRLLGPGRGAEAFQRDVVDALRALGYDGFKLRDDFLDSYAIFDASNKVSLKDTTPSNSIKAAGMSPIDGNATEAAAMTRTADAVGGTPQRPQDAAQAQAAGDAAPSFGENPFEINFSKIAQPDDVNSVIAQMIESRPDAIDAARRGVQTWEQSKAGAEALTQSDKAFVDLLSRRPGQAANDKETIALRMLWGESGKKLREVAKLAADNPTDANMMVFRQMLSVHGTIEEAAMGARAEAGRALQTWRMLVGSSEAIATRVRELVNGSDGSLRDGNINLARQIGALDDSTIGEIARKAPQMTNAARMRTIIQASMLTAPSTHVANITGNAMGMTFETALRALAPMTTGGTGAVKEGEAFAMFAGQLQAFWDVVRAGDKFKAFWNQAEQSGGKAEMNAQHMFPKMAGSKNEAIRAVANVGDFLVKLPGGATNAMDNVFKYALTSGSLNASAFRKAMDEVNAGALDREDLIKRQRELVANPTDDMIDEAGRLSEEATFSRSQETWTDSEGKSGPGWGKIMLNIRQAAERGGPAGGYASGVIMPFINTPANIMSYAFRSSPLAPMMARYQKDLAEGGARAEIARTRMMAGSAIMWTAFSLAANGQLSGGGPIDPQQRQLLQRQGWQPYSVRVGDTWYSYSRLDPMGTLFSIASDLGDIALNTDWADMDSIEQWSEIAATAVGAIGNAYVNKSMLSGAADLFEFMGDPKRYGEQFILSKLSAPIPAAVGLGERLGDPYARDPMVAPREPGGANDILSGLESFMQQAKTRIPGVSETLPIRRDMWGRPQMQVSGMGTAWEILSPSRASKNKWEPIDGELERLKYYPQNMQRTLTLPAELAAGPGDDRRYSLADRPDIYNRILEVRGEIILPRLNAMVNGEGNEGAIYAASDDVAKQEMIEDVIGEGSKIARDQVIQEYYVDLAAMSAKRANAIGVAPAPVE